MPIEKHVAIIGGGIGGLSAAYFLQNRLSADGRFVFKCAVFERRKRWGGNADTAYLETLFQPPFADLGVNDFNLNTYHIMKSVLEQLAKDGFPVPYANLLDKTNFSTSRQNQYQSISYAASEIPEWEKFKSTKPYLKDINDGWNAFKKAAHGVMHDPKYRYMSVGEFLEGPPAYGDAFRDYNILPRINGMYFMDDGLPQDMPILGVMSYYHLQEGIGDASAPKPDRKYFVNGASDWVRQLVRALEKRGVEMYLDDAPTVIARSPTELHVLSRHSSRVSWDYAISAVYADQVPNVIAAGLPPLMPTLLAQFRYFTSISIVHNYEDVMPPPKERLTYNILIHQQEARMLRPYTIAYVSKMHQGEETKDAPFVSLSPSIPIPEDDIFEMVDVATGDKIKSVAYFRHNMVSIDSLAAQRMMDAFQGHNGIYFTGGWTKGAGLHEEILSTSLDVANRIRGYFVPGQSHSYSERDPEYVPKYVRDSFETRDVEVLPPGFWD